MPPQPTQPLHQPANSPATTKPVVSPATEPVRRPLIVGEVLFDCFPEGRVLGGAPFNVAWNLRGLNCHPMVVTAVGDDELGQEVLQRVARWGIDPKFIQVCRDKPTGRVDIETTNGEPSYRFCEDVAFDHIQCDEQLFAQAKPALMYQGSLALRSPHSRQSIRRIRERLCSPVESEQSQASCATFVDVNIRLPHFDLSWVPSILSQAEHVKLNHDELSMLSADEREPASESDRWLKRRSLGEKLMMRYGIRNLWITAAEEGAAWLGERGQFVHSPAPIVPQLCDTVGAGDALASVIIYGILHDHEFEQILDDGVQFAARVCTIRGAISNDASFYRGEFS